MYIGTSGKELWVKYLEANNYFSDQEDMIGATLVFKHKHFFKKYTRILSDGCNCVSMMSVHTSACCCNVFPCFANYTSPPKKLLVAIFIIPMNPFYSLNFFKKGNLLTVTSKLYITI